MTDSVIIFPKKYLFISMNLHVSVNLSNIRFLGPHLVPIWSPFLLPKVPIWSPFHSKSGPHLVPILKNLGPHSMWEQWYWEIFGCWSLCSQVDQKVYAVKIARERYRGPTDRTRKLEEVESWELFSWLLFLCLSVYTCPSDGADGSSPPFRLDT